MGEVIPLWNPLAPYGWEPIEATFDKCGIPNHMRESIIRYCTEGTNPGHFLSAVINNDLVKAVQLADLSNRKLLANYVTWFFNYAPAGCWGKPNSTETWALECKVGITALKDD